MSRHEHAPHTTNHRLGWIIVALLGGLVLWALLLVVAKAAAEGLG